jgi:type II secretory pathway predicted ATPase ExeA
MEMNNTLTAAPPVRFQETGPAKSPFHNAPDPDLFFGSAQHKQALETLTSALRIKRGLFLLMGEIGTGKTTLCRYLQRTLPSGFRFGQISNPFVSPREFEEQIQRELGLAEEASRRDFFRTLGEHLFAEHRAGRTVVLLIDEGHLISLELFDHILILSNIQHDGVHLLQIILAGQPELQEILKRPRFASLNQRISTRIFLTGLNRLETGAYINHRLSLVPTRIPVAFGEDALTAVWKGSGGIPRLINHICERVLAKNYEENGGSKISGAQVLQVLEDPLLSPLLPKRGKGSSRGFICFLVGLGIALALSLVILAGLSHVAPDLLGKHRASEPQALPQAPVVMPETGEPQEFAAPVSPGRPDSPGGPEQPDEPSPAQGDEEPLETLPVVADDEVESETESTDSALQEETPPEMDQDEEQQPEEPEDPSLKENASQEMLGEEESFGSEASDLGVPDEQTDPAPEQPSEPAPVIRDLPAQKPAAPARTQPRQPAAQGRDVRINAIVWHADPAQRMAVVNGAIVKEGRTSGEVKVIRINREDVEFEHRGIRFTKGIQSNRRDFLQTLED